jgi:hypothetical protein
MNVGHTFGDLLLEISEQKVKTATKHEVEQLCIVAKELRCPMEGA